jgi:hypothetical protein
MPLDDPNSLSTQLISRLLVIAMFWGIAWGVGWFTGSSIGFYLIGALGTIMGLLGIVREIRFQRNYKSDHVPPYL